MGFSSIIHLFFALSLALSCGDDGGGSSGSKATSTSTPVAAPQSSTSNTNSSTSTDGATVSTIEVDAILDPIVETRKIHVNLDHLSHSSVEVLLNSSDALILSSSVLTGTFSSEIEEGSSYSVTINNQPNSPSLSCSLSNATGIAGGSDITVELSCPELQSIELSLNSTTIQVGDSTSFQVWAVFESGLQNISTLASVTSSDSMIASINALSLEASSVGTADITASFGGHSSSVNVTSEEANLVSLFFEKSNYKMIINEQNNLKVFGNYDNGQTLDVTTKVTIDLYDNLSQPATGVSYNAVSNSLSGLSVQTGTITASLDGQSSTSNFEVTGASIVSLDISPVIYQTSKNSSKAFLATAFYDDGSIEDVTQSANWSSSDESIAVMNFLNVKGLANFISEGNVTVTADYLGLSASSSVVVNLPNPTAIIISVDSNTVPVGQSVQLQISADYGDGDIRDVTSDAVFQSSDSSVVSVSNATDYKGLVSGILAGTVTITADFLGLSETISIESTVATLSSLSISPQAPMIPKGIDFSFAVTGNYDDGSSIELTNDCSFSSSDSNLISMSANPGEQGIASNVSVDPNIQTVTITANCEGLSISTDAIVNPSNLVGINLSVSSATMNTFKTLKINAYGSFDDGASQDISSYVTWESTDSGAVHVSNASGENGLVSAISEATATITASLSGLSGTASIVVDDSQSQSSVQVGLGLKGKYYSATVNTIPDMGSLVLKGERIDENVGFSWASGSAPLGVGDDFYVIWQGYFSPEESGNYTFSTLSDDGVKLFISDKSVVSNWTLHAATWNSGTVYLEQGYNYPIQLEFYERGGQAQIELHYQTDTIPRTLVPQSMLFPAGDGFVLEDPVPPTLTALISNYALINGEVGSLKNLQFESKYSNGDTFQLSYDDLSFIFNNQSIVDFNNSTQMVIELLQAGTTSIDVTYDSVSLNIPVNIQASSPNSLSVQVAEQNLIVENTTSYTVLAEYPDGSSTNVTSNASLNIVNSSVLNGSNNEILALAEGTSDVEFSYGGISVTKSFSVSANDVTTLKLSEDIPMMTSTFQYKTSVIGIKADLSEQVLTQCSVGAENSSVFDASFVNGELIIDSYTVASPTTESIELTCLGLTTTLSLLFISGEVTGINANVETLDLAAFDTFEISVNATLDDGGSIDVSRFANYLTTDSTVAVVGNIESPSRITAINNGNTTINISYKGHSDSIALSVTDTPTEIVYQGDGLKGEYYTVSFVNNMPDLNTKTLQGTRVDADINFNWGNGNAPMGFGNQFYVNWTGFIYIPEDGDYIFSTYSDDGVKLFFNDMVNPAISNWTNHGGTWNYSATLSLTKGFYPVLLDYYENGGGSVIQLHYEHVGVSGRTSIPQSLLFSENPSL